MKRAQLQILLAVFLTVPVVGQQDQVESPEHKKARATCEDDQKQYDYWHTKMVEKEASLDQEMAAMKNCKTFDCQRAVNGREQTLVIVLKTMQKELDRSQSDLNISRTKLEHVDECVKVYGVTIDKTASALTVRETEAISACKSMGMYPPPK